MHMFFIMSIISMIYFLKSIKIVNQSESYIIERLGKYYKTAYAGLHFIVPLLDKIRAKIDLREQFLLLQPQVFITNDNISI